MAWKIANTEEYWDGPTHKLGAVTYSGATRTPESRRLVSAPEVEIKKPVRRKRVSKSAKPK